MGLVVLVLCLYRNVYTNERIEYRLEFAVKDFLKI